MDQEQDNQNKQTGHNKSNAEGGKPSKDHFKEPFLEAFKTTGTILAACKKVGINRGTVAAWRERDPEFAAKFIDADLTVTETLERTALNVALDKTNKSQATMLIFLLKSRYPEKYRERITHDVNVKFIETVVTEVAAIVRKHAPIELSNEISRELEALSTRLVADAA